MSTLFLLLVYNYSSQMSTKKTLPYKYKVEFFMNIMEIARLELVTYTLRTYRSPN